MKNWCVRDPLGVQPEYGEKSGYFTLKFNHGGYFAGRNWEDYMHAYIAYIDYCHGDWISLKVIHDMVKRIGYSPEYASISWRMPSPEMNHQQLRKLQNEFDVSYMVMNHLPTYDLVELYMVTKSAMDLTDEDTYHEAEIEKDGLSADGNQAIADQYEGHEKNSYDFQLDEFDNEIFADDGDLDIEVNVVQTLGESTSAGVSQQGHGCVHLSRREKQGIQQEGNKKMVMGYSFDIDTEYEDSDELDSLDDASDTEKERYPKFTPKTDMDDPKFKLGMIFPSFDVLKSAIRLYAIKNRYSVTLEKNDKQRVRAKCKDDCSWVLYATRLHDRDGVQVKTYMDDHSCSRALSNKFATGAWIAEKYLETIRSDPDISLSTLIHLIKEGYNISVDRSKVHRAKHLALKWLRGDETEQYMKLANYGGELRRTSPGSSVILSLDNLVFQKIFVCISGSKNGLLAGCRPIISLDGCFLKGRYGGQLLAAIGIDPNDCIWPIAYAVVNVESRATWTWFLELLGEQLQIENNHNWTFISDGQKGLIQAMQSIFPNAEHRHCVRHLIANFRKRFSGEALKNTIWAAARSTYMSDFKKHMDHLKSLSAEAWAWMDAIPAEQWSRSHFREDSKCDILLSNISECFNRFILDARDKPILTLLEMIRSKIMVRIANKRERMTKWNGLICPKIKKKLEQNKEDSRYCWPSPSGGAKFQVNCPQDQFVVDIVARRCSCRKWELTGIPCTHACATLAYNGNKIEEFVHECYLIDTCAKVYDNIIEPIRSMDQWDDVHHNPIQPPTSAPPKPGRPKKKRRRESGEPAPKGKMGRLRMIMHCRNCGGSGHNKKSCKNPPKQAKKPTTCKSTRRTTTVECGPSQSTHALSGIEERIATNTITRWMSDGTTQSYPLTSSIQNTDQGRATL